ncbi:MAG: SDR family oxidoreductase [Acidisphaera sp.]|nr:SDR family oxidoreductase [Acidisphaera sp.]
MSGTHGDGATPGSALIIGASRGLGLGLVHEHLRRGWRVLATVRTPSDALDALRREFQDRLRVETLDMNDVGQVDSLAERLAAEKFDLLFVNAGISAARDLPISEVAQADIDRVLTTNAISPVRLADRLIERVAPDGTIGFMTSGLGSVAGNTAGGWELYRASKAALNTLTRSFAARRGAGRTILSVHPGWVRTDMGGSGAPLDVATSTRGIAETLEKRRRTGGHVFVDYRNQEIAW